MTRLTSSIGSVRSKTSWLTAASLRAQLPAGPIDDPLPDPPLAPDRAADRAAARSVVRWFSSTMSLNASAIAPGEARLAFRQANAEVAAPKGAERAQDGGAVDAVQSSRGPRRPRPATDELPATRARPRRAAGRRAGLVKDRRRPKRWRSVGTAELMARGASTPWFGRQCAARSRSRRT